MTMPDLRPMGIGQVLDRSFQTLRGHFGTLFVTALIGTSPWLLLYAVMANPYAGAATPDQMTASPLLFIGAMLLIAFGTVLLWGALGHQVTQAATGGRVSIADGFRNGFRSLLPLAGAGIGAYVALLLLLIPIGILVALGMFLGIMLFGEGALAMSLVAVAAGVPGLLLMVGWMAMFFLILPAVVADRRGPIDAIRRANRLAKGGRFRIFVTACIAWMVTFLPTMGIPFLLGIGATLWSPDAAGMVSTTQLVLYQATTLLAAGVTTPFLVGAMVFTYYDRRARREGYDVELASAALAPQT